MRLSVRPLVALLVMLSASSWAQKDLYEVLGVARDATPRQIKRAYHKVSPSVATCVRVCVCDARIDSHTVVCETPEPPTYPVSCPPIAHRPLMRGARHANSE